VFENVCVVFDVNVNEPPPLSCSTSVPVSPVTAALIVYVLVVHVAVTVRFEVIVPLALLLSVQVWPEGCVPTVTEYVAPLVYVFENVCVVFDVKVNEPPALSCSTRVPVSPVTVALIVYVFVVHVAVTVMFEVMVPLALLLSVQVCPEGWVPTVTEYVDPLVYVFENVCVVFDVKVNDPPPLSCSTNVPVSPVTDALIV
jgi:hypothetical protein